VLASPGSAVEGLLGPTRWLAHVADPPNEGPDPSCFASAFRGAESSAR
jgi:hypothetical protein